MMKEETDSRKHMFTIYTDKNDFLLCHKFMFSRAGGVLPILLKQKMWEKRIYVIGNIDLIKNFTSGPYLCKHMI